MDIGIRETETSVIHYFIERDTVGNGFTYLVHILDRFFGRRVLFDLSVTSHHIESQHRESPTTLVLPGHIGIENTIR